MRNIIFTGGGSGGHLMPALSLIKKLEKDKGLKLIYIGGRDSIERTQILKMGIKYYPIFTGKLRRYLSFENVIDIFKVIIGLFQSVIIMLSFKSNKTLVFSTGGFVSVPVVIAAWLTRKKIFIHEQTTRVGLANMVCSKFADTIFVSFKESLEFFPKNKTILSGNPLREEVYIKEIGEVIIDGVNLKEVARPILFVTGGGNGALLLNELIRLNLEDLKKEYFVVHQVGKRFLKEYINLKDDNYKPVEFVEQIIDLFKIAKVIISRAGAGTVCELIALEKRSIFVPLKIAQKNEQYHNAMAAKRVLSSIVIKENDLPNTDVINLLKEFLKYQKENRKIEKIVKATDIILSHINGKIS